MRDRPLPFLILALTYCILLSSTTITTTNSFQLPPPQQQSQSIMLRFPSTISSSATRVNLRSKSSSRFASTLINPPLPLTLTLPKPKVIIITGPTASGKTKLTYDLCSTLGSNTIISADSVQIFQDVTIGANKPSDAELNEYKHINHTLLSELDLSVGGNTAMYWLDRVSSILGDYYSPSSSDSIEGRKPPVLISGGTMMYIDWLTKGSPSAPGRDAKYDTTVERIMNTITVNGSEKEWSVILDNLKGVLNDENENKATFSDMNEEMKSEAVAKFRSLTVNDLYRLRRSLEIVIVSSQSEEPQAKMFDTATKKLQLSDKYDIRKFFICPESRMDHYHTIDSRCLKMIDDGLMSEVGGLILEKGILGEGDDGEGESSITKSIGYRQVIAYLTRPDPVRSDKEAWDGFFGDFTTATRRYAKKQQQWFRKDDACLFVGVPSSTAADEINAMVDLDRSEYDVILGDVNSNSNEIKKRNEAQGKGMKVFQCQVNISSTRMAEIMEDADSWTSKTQRLAWNSDRDRGSSVGSGSGMKGKRNFSTSASSQPLKVAVIGGGASGVFSAITIASKSKSKKSEEREVKVSVLEATSKFCQKIKVSGGGRCNILPNTSLDLKSQIIPAYARGSRELLGPMISTFGPKEAREWFESRGVRLKTEDDGRTFPVSDDSQEVIDCLMTDARIGGVDMRKKCVVKSVVKDEVSNQFVVTYTSGIDTAEESETFDAIVLATGSSKQGYVIAKSLGHSIVQPVSSLFTLNCKEIMDPSNGLHGLAGTSIEDSIVTVEVFVDECDNAKPTYQTQRGPMLITHVGISGPAALKTSAFAARELAGMKYACKVIVNFVPGLCDSGDVKEGVNHKVFNVKGWKKETVSNSETVGKLLFDFSRTGSERKREVGTLPLFMAKAKLSKRLWGGLVDIAAASGGGSDVHLSKKTWAQLTQGECTLLANALTSLPLRMNGKNTNKEEFTTAGGISLREVDFKGGFQSKKTKGMFVLGELLDVDGITGGYNFMGCWLGGYSSGEGVLGYLFPSTTTPFSAADDVTTTKRKENKNRSRSGSRSEIGSNGGNGESDDENYVALDAAEEEEGGRVNNEL